MPTIIEKRRAVSRKVNWQAYREQRERLAELFPAISHNGGHKRPLVIGIKHDLIGANVGLSAAEIGNFLSAYTFGPKYLSALRCGASRVDLDGFADGEVSRQDADYAALCLKAHYADRERLRAIRRLGLSAVGAALVDNSPKAGVALAYHFAREAA